MTYQITFKSGETMNVSKNDVTSETINNAIAYIENEPGATGVTLENGIRVNKV